MNKNYKRKQKIQLIIERLSWHIHRVRTKIRIFYWRIIYDIEIGKNTDFKDLNYINTGYGPISIGNNCQINAFGLTGPLEIGDNVLINHMSDISGRAGKVTIGSNVLIAPRVSIIATTHNFQSKEQLIKAQGVRSADVEIGDDAWIGSNVVILPGVRIGKGAVVGANSVVSKDIPEYAVVAGAPARIIDHRG